MKTNRTHLTLLSLFLCIALLAAAASCMAETAEEPLYGDKELLFLGEGERSFLFSVTDAEGNETWYQICTDAETVGEALLALELISGEEGPYGLYIHEVCGIRAVWEECGKYWAFYINGEYAMSGVDTTVIEEGTVYSLKVE